MPIAVIRVNHQHMLIQWITSSRVRKIRDDGVRGGGDEAHTVSTRCVILARRLSKCVLSACRAPGSRERPPALLALLVVVVVEDGGAERRRRCWAAMYERSSCERCRDGSVSGGGFMEVTWRGDLSRWSPVSTLAGWRELRSTPSPRRLVARVACVRGFLIWRCHRGQWV